MTGALLVIGATGAIGRAVVEAALDAGRAVVAVARGCSGLKALEARHPDADLTLLRASVSTDRGADRLLAQLRRVGRPVDGVVVALRGGSDHGRLLDDGIDALRRRIDEDVAPHAAAARHLLPWLAGQAPGLRYVVVGGPGSGTPWSGYGRRSVAAAALRMLVRVLHDEALPSGVRVQMLDVATPARTDANAMHACPQWPSARAIGERALALATAPRGRFAAPVVDFALTPHPSPHEPSPRDPDIADARVLLESLTSHLPRDFDR